MQDNKTYDILEGTVTMPRTTQNIYYTVTLVDDSLVHDVAPSDLYGANDVPSAGKPSTSLGFFRPDWMKQGQKVMLLHDDVYKQGFLNIDKNSMWEFVSRDADGRILFFYSYADLQFSWKIRMQENTFDIGWQEYTKRVFGIGRHVSATGVHNTHFAPPNLNYALAGNNPDSNIWNKFYVEQYDGLDRLNVFTEITTNQYYDYVVK